MFLNGNPQDAIKKKAVIADNDFLGLIYESEDLLKDTLTLLSGKKLYLYPFTEFEFLRDVFAPKVRILKEKFVASPIFGHISEAAHLRIFPKLFKNALLLSKMFAHQNLSNGEKKKVSFVDLMLASLLMYLKDKSVLITGNKKDFPSCVFDVVSVINFESKEDNIRSISILKFNQEKFDGCYESLNKLDNRATKAEDKKTEEK